MLISRVALAVLIAVSVSGCASQTSSVDENSVNESANSNWVDATEIEFFYDHRTGVATAPEVLDELKRQATSSSSPIEWRQDADEVPRALEPRVDDVLSSSGAGETGCGLWVFGSRGWSAQAVDAGYFDWVQEDITWGEFSDGILGYVLIYSDDQAECYVQAMRTIEGEYAPNPNVGRGIEPNPFLAIEFWEEDSSLTVGNDGDAPIILNDELCIVTEEGVSVVASVGRIVGTLYPGEAVRISDDFTAEGNLDSNVSKLVAVGNCLAGEYRAIVLRE
jgi:hypothetical protein